MVTGVGLDAAASCAAIRCGIDGFTETRFIDADGEWIIGCPVPFVEGWRGRQKLVRMVGPPIAECLATIPEIRPEAVPLLLCLSERDRPGRLVGLEEELYREICSELGVWFHPRSVVVPQGRVAAAAALRLAQHLIDDERLPYCIVAGVDSLLVDASLAAYEEQNRLLTSENSNGFIPGEAGAALLIGSSKETGPPGLLCLGLGVGREEAPIGSDQPLRADGLVQACRAALVDAGCSYADLDYRITDGNGEQYWFKEATLALTRTLRLRKERFDIWTPADCIGETGAAAGPCVLAVALAAARKGYAPGRGVLCHFASDDNVRVAIILAYARSAADV
jgi:3-oxoacyl-[acyl-carrier-protein] synthase-1